MSDAALSASTLAARLDRRARRLRLQAHVILGVIVAILVAGAVAFVFANQIVSLGTPSYTAADQYAAALAADKQIKDQMAQIDTKLNAILDSSSIEKPFDEKITQSRNELIAYENPLIANCQIDLEKRDDSPEVDITVRSAPDRLGNFIIHIPLRILYFVNSSAAEHCVQQFGGKVYADIVQMAGKLQVLINSKQTAINQFRSSKKSEMNPYNEQYNELEEKQRDLYPIVTETKQRATEERILGAPLGGSSAPPGAKLPTTDWQQVIQSSITRVSSLAIMFFLVAMTPNIDFGKAPSTPIDQLIEMIKAAKN
jgi:hypothetical protein